MSGSMSDCTAKKFLIQVNTFTSVVFFVACFCLLYYFFFSKDAASTRILLWFICWHFLSHCAWHAHAVHVIRLARCQYCAGGIALQASPVWCRGLWETCISYNG